MTVEEQFRISSRVIRDRAWSWSEKMTIEYRELVAEGNLIFMELWNNKGHIQYFNAYLERSLNSEFLRMQQRQEREQERLVLIPDVAEVSNAAYIPNYDHALTMDMAMSQLSERERGVVHVALTACPGRRMSRTRLLRELKARSWPWHECIYAFARIRSAMADVVC